MPANTYHLLEQRFAEWALTQPAIQAVIVVGSRARLDHPADEWSDLDLVVFASETALYFQDSAWLNACGDVIAALANSFGGNDREWLALYADGGKLDVAFLTIDPAMASTLQVMLDRFPYPVVLQRGVRVLLDKTGAPDELRLPQIDVPPLPTPAEFTALTKRLWFDALKTAKAIRRHDLWRAKQLCDAALKQHLLTLLEWQAATQPGTDMWYDGRFLAEWADRETLASLPETFAAYDVEDMRRALLATLDLFRRLAYTVSTQLGYEYPAEADRLVDAQLHSILRGTA